MTCPQCRSTAGFKEKLSRHHKDKLEKLEFECPEQGCKVRLKYKEALAHNENCLPGVKNVVEKLKSLLKIKDKEISKLRNEKDKKI